MVLNDKAKQLYDLLYTKNFDLEALKRALQSGAFDRDDVNDAGYMYVDHCMDDLMDDDWVVHHGGPGEVLPGYESSHMLEAVGVLLEYGLDPNTVYKEPLGKTNTEDFNIMRELKYIDNGYLAADTLALLLENGGNPSIIFSDGSFVQTVNSDLDYDLDGQYDRIRFDALVHYWMVLVGYGARLENGEPYVEPRGGFDIAKLRNHRDYYYGAIYSDRYKGRTELCFFDKETNREVARF